MLAEYDENGSLTTYYTRGEELISQERSGAKSYYVYDGFDSVRMLTDGEGSVTDTYTFDAFGNLTKQTGNTENSYLYRGEQFDSFTGLYYLRARYMNPSTGTFITMDEYAGSVFEPVSLHKYLYANANPVMYSDPSGYSTEGTLTGKMTAIAVIGILSCTILPNYSKFVNAIGFLLTEISDVFTITVDSILEWVEGLSCGKTTSIDIDSELKNKISNEVPNIYVDAPSCDSNITYAKSNKPNSKAKPRSKYPPARRIRCKSKKEAREKAKQAGKRKKPIHHPNDPKGPHYHPDVPNSQRRTPHEPCSHDHYFY